MSRDVAERVRGHLYAVWGHQACRINPSDWPRVFAALMKPASKTEGKEATSSENYGRGSLKPAFDEAVTALTEAFSNGPPTDPFDVVWRAFPQLDAQHRAKLAALLGEEIRLMPARFDGLPLGQAGAVLVDPPWFFTTYSDKGRAKAADQHYACLSLTDITALPVAALAAPDCALTLWSPQAFVEIALGVMTAWGFRFVCMGAWAKQSRTGTKWQFGTGLVLRSASEFYLIGKRGNPKRQSRGVRNLIVAPVREHSRKPDEIYQQIEALWPGPYVELFARYPREGWLSWGDELTAEASS